MEKKDIELEIDNLEKDEDVLTPHLNEEQQARVDQTRQKGKLRTLKRIAILSAGILAVLVIAMVLFNENGIHFKGEKEQIYTYGEEFDVVDATAYYGGSLIPFFRHNLNVTCDGEVDVNTPGEYTLTFTAEYKGETRTYKETITIEDTEAPVITLVNDGNSYTSPGHEYVEEGYTAIDNYEGDITDRVQVSEEDGVVTYTVSDCFGNTATATRTITYKDVVEPVITLEGGATVYVAMGAEYNEAGYTAEDDVDGDLTDAVSVSGSVDTATAGDYTLTYSVTDSSGNTGSIDRTVTVVKADPTEKVIYLTFDDGPGPYTEELLDLLDEYGVKVTFFVTNNFPEYNYMIGEEASRGHTVAIHTYSHKYDQIYASLDAYYDDLCKCADLIYSETGSYPTIVRFPGGTSNMISANYCEGIMTDIVSHISDWGYIYYDWNVDSGDADGLDTASEVYSNTISQIKEHNVSVVLQHDIKEFSVDAVEDIIQWGLANGYTFLPLTESSTRVQHPVNN